MNKKINSARKSSAAAKEATCVTSATGIGAAICKVLGLFTLATGLISGYSYLMKYQRCQLEKERAQTEAAKDNMVSEGGPTGGWS